MEKEKNDVNEDEEKKTQAQSKHKLHTAETRAPSSGNDTKELQFSAGIGKRVEWREKQKQNSSDKDARPTTVTRQQMNAYNNNHLEYKTW